MSILVVIFIIVIIMAAKQGKLQGEKNAPNQPQRQNVPSNSQKQKAYTYQTVKSTSEGTQPVKRSISESERRRLEEYRAAKGAKIAQPQQDILAKAQKNAKKYEKDTTLEQLEQEHKHSEQVKPTMTKEEHTRQKEAHPHDAAHVSDVVSAESESILGTIEDLMVKGYDSNLSYERDFVGEAMDMIGRFSVVDSTSGSITE